jgi:hypothetical protein
MRQNRPVPGRRLILVLVMLLITLSVLSASRDISRRGPAGQGQQVTTTTQPARPAEKKNESKGTADRRAQATTGTTARRLPSDRPVRARLGERVVLRVKTGSPDIIAIDALGVRAPTGPGTGGTLDFVAGTAGDFPVTLALGERKIGTLSVSR